MAWKSPGLAALLPHRPQGLLGTGPGGLSARGHDPASSCFPLPQEGGRACWGQGGSAGLRGAPRAEGSARDSDAAPPGPPLAPSHPAGVMPQGLHVARPDLERAFERAAAGHVAPATTACSVGPSGWTPGSWPGHTSRVWSKAFQTSLDNGDTGQGRPPAPVRQDGGCGRRQDSLLATPGVWGALGGPRNCLLQHPLEGVPRCHPHDPGSLPGVQVLRGPQPRPHPEACPPWGRGPADCSEGSRPWRRWRQLPGGAAGDPRNKHPRGPAPQVGLRFHPPWAPSSGGARGGLQTKRKEGRGADFSQWLTRPIFQNKHQDTWSDKGFLCPAECKGHAGS